MMSGSKVRLEGSVAFKFLPAAKPGRSMSQFWPPPPPPRFGKGECKNEGFPNFLGIERGVEK